MNIMRPSSSPTPYSTASHPDSSSGAGAGSPGTSAGPTDGAAHHRLGSHNRATAGGLSNNGGNFPSMPGVAGLGFGVAPPMMMINGASKVAARQQAFVGSTPTLPSAMGAAAGGGANAVSLNKGAALSGLRPLPNRPTGALANMMIQGHSAGEGRTINPTEPRVPAERKPSAPLENGVNRDARDTAKLRRLETELEKLKELLKKRTSERDKASTRVEELEKELADVQKRLEEQERTSSAALVEKGQLIINLQLQLTQLEEKLAKQAAENEKAKKQHGKAGEEADFLRSALEKERKERAEVEAALKKDLADLQKRFDETNESRRRNSTDLQSQLDRLQAELAKKSKESEQWEKLAQQREEELKSQEASFKEWKTRIEAINEYILKICQPQFSVVKDESLAPVAPTGDPATSGQEGFVLVPLPLMLQGYGLLPPELKKRIATDYETSKKNLASQIARRSSRQQ